MPEYLYEYNHNGERWSFSIWGEDRDDAQERVNKLPLARYCGEVYMRVPAQLGWFAKLWCVVVNFFKSRN
jgi:hypothetical protein